MARSIAATLTGGAQPEDGAMQDVTPKQVGPAAAAQRMAPLSTGTPFEHDGIKLVSVAYAGRKNARGLVSRRTPKAEHIDVTVPYDRGDNEDAVSDYAAGVNAANIPDDKRAEAGLEWLTSEHVHLSGRHYHFEQGRVNHRIHPDDVAFLLAHDAYKFERITDE